MSKLEDSRLVVSFEVIPYHYVDRSISVKDIHYRNYEKLKCNIREIRDAFVYNNPFAIGSSIFHPSRLIGVTVTAIDYVASEELDARWDEYQKSCELDRYWFEINRMLRGYVSWSS